MPTYRCPLCKKKFFIDNIEAAGEVVSCPMCGSSINTENLDKEDTQQEPNIAIEKAENSQITYDEHSIYTDSTTENVLLKILNNQLEELKSIKNMLKFFTVLTIISLVISFILVLLISY